MTTEHIQEVDNFVNSVSGNMEDLCDLGYLIINFGEDWEDYGKFQKSTGIIQHFEKGFFLAVCRERVGSSWEGWETKVSDIYQVEPVEVKHIEYRPVKDKDMP